MQMVNLAKQYKCTYSRYADDLTFSTNRKYFPQPIAYKINPDENQWAPGLALRRKIEACGFSINPSKVTMQYKTNRQLTTGLVVNKKVNVRREYYKYARSMCHHLFTKGTYYVDGISSASEVSTMEPEPDGSGEHVGGPPNLERLEGILSFVYNVKHDHDERSLGARREKPNAVTKLYRNFLFYKNFFALEQPLIVCEGETDIIYLRVAIKKLASSYEILVTVNEDEVNFRIKFLKFSDNLKHVLAISEGAGGVANMMEMYKRSLKNFTAEGKSHPVIIVADSDEGSAPILSKLGEDKKKDKEFYHFVENLYVVLTPLSSDGTGTMMEDFFDEDTLATKVNGKKFNPKGKIQPDSEYGKVVFAKKVVAHKEKGVDFSKFSPILDRIVSAINHYYDSISST